MSATTIEYIGYLAMAFIGVSFLMKNIRTLRLLNLIGAALFIYYGILLNQPPIYLLNSFIVLVNLFYLSKKKEN
ncbi:MAG: uroporphyrinogen decarboxylase [Flavobacteriales bacterium]